MPRGGLASPLLAFGPGLDEPSQGTKLLAAHRLPAPAQADLPGIGLVRQRPRHHRAAFENARGQRAFGKQGRSHPLGDHSDQRVQAGRRKGRLHPSGSRLQERQCMAVKALILLQEQKRLAVEVILAQTLRIGERMLRAAGEPVGILEQGHRLEAAHVIGEGHEQQIEPARRQPLEQSPRLVLPQHQPQLRISPADVGQEPRKKKRPDRRDHPEGELTGQRQGCPRTHLDERLGLLEKMARPLGDLETGRCDEDGPLRALGQRDAEHGFEFPDANAERRLGHPACIRRPSEMAVIRQGDEIAQLPQIRERLHRQSFPSITEARIIHFYELTQYRI